MCPVTWEGRHANRSGKPGLGLGLGSRSVGGERFQAQGRGSGKRRPERARGRRHGRRGVRQVPRPGDARLGGHGGVEGPGQVGPAADGVAPGEGHAIRRGAGRSALCAPMGRRSDGRPHHDRRRGDPLAGDRHRPGAGTPTDGRVQRPMPSRHGAGVLGRGRRAVQGVG